MLKKMFFLLLILALLLAACGGKDDDKKEEPKVEFTYQDYQIQVTNATIQDTFDAGGEIFTPDPGFKIVNVQFEVVSGVIPSSDVDWVFTISDEAGNASESAIHMTALQSADDGSLQIKIFSEIFSVPENAQRLTVDIDGAVQVDITPVLTRQ